MQTLTSLRTLVDQGRGLRFTESPRWHQGRFWFLDIHDKRIKTIDLQGTLETALELPFLPNSLGLTPQGDWVFSDALARKVYRWSGQTGQPAQPLADIAAQTVFCMSDGICDAQGRLYIGDIGYNFFDPANPPVNTCVIVRVDTDGKSTVVADGLSFPNGMAFSADGKTLVVAETMAQRLTAFDVDAQGLLQHRRVWASLPEGTHPDGICMDSEGAIWVANPQGADKVLRVREGGEITHRVHLPQDAFAVALGGPEGRQLLVCTSATHNPAELAQNPSARLMVLDV